MNQKIAIVDLDGTLANLDHRLHHIKGDKKDWQAFFAASGDDSPIQGVIDLVNELSSNLAIYIVSGRSDSALVQTADWLKRHGVNFDQLIMRRDGDYTPDHDLKRQWAEEYGWTPESVMCVLEDRASVVKMWRSMGLTCLQVAEGDF